MRLTNYTRQVVAVMYAEPDRFFYPVDIAEQLGTAGKGVLVTVRDILQRLLNAGYVVKMDAIEVMREGYNGKPRLYRISTAGKKLALEQKLEGFRGFGKRMYMIVPK